MARIIPLKLNRNGKSSRRQQREEAPTVADRVARLREEMEGLEHLAKEQATDGQRLPSFVEFENAVKEKLDAVGRAVTALFLTHADERVAAACKDGLQCGDRFLRPAPQLQPRNMTGRFGMLRYFRTYLRQNHAGRRRGFHLLDVTLGLSTDRFSWNVLSLSARLATKVSYAEAKATLGLLLPAQRALDGGHRADGSGPGQVHRRLVRATATARGRRRGSCGDDRQQGGAHGDRAGA